MQNQEEKKQKMQINKLMQIFFQKFSNSQSQSQSVEVDGIRKLKKRKKKKQKKIKLKKMVMKIMNKKFKLVNQYQIL